MKTVFARLVQTGSPERQDSDKRTAAGVRSISSVVAVKLPAVLALFALLSPTLAGAQDTPCPPTINSCGCVINAPGAYKVGVAINDTQGLTSSGACIDITSSFVTLDVSKKAITGPGGDSPTGVGIRLASKARQITFIEGRGAVVSGWDIGLLIEGKNSNVDGFAANANGTAGIKLLKAQNIKLTNTMASSNTNYGVWLRASSSNTLSNLKTQTNGNIGVYVGCADIGPISASCPGVGTSSGNHIFNGNVANNTNYGVALDIGTKNSIITNNSVTGGHNSKNDLFDANPSCGTDQWFGNDSTATASPNTCIK